MPLCTFADMGFGYPLFLLAAFAVLIPILIHLFNFRRYKTVYFTNTKLLKSIKEQKNKIQNIKDILILLLRVLTIFFLVLAFTQPFFGKKDSAAYGNNSVVIYVDNSPSMGLKLQSLNVLEIAKARALEIVNSYTGTDRFMLLTNDMYGEHNHWMSKQDILSYLQQIQLSSNTKDLATVTSKLLATLADVSTKGKKAYILSDFQQHIAGNIPPIPKEISMHWLPLQSGNRDNIFIDSCWEIDPISNPNAAKRLAIRVVNTSDKEKENLRVTLKVNDQAKSINEMDVPPHGKRIDTFSYNSTGLGWQDGIFVFDDYPITFDDKFYFSQKANTTYKVLSIEDASSTSAIFSIFNGDPAIQIVRGHYNSMDLSIFSQYQLIILNEVPAISPTMTMALTSYLSQGGSIFIIPSPHTDINSINSLLSQIDAGRLGALVQHKGEVTQLNLQEDVINSIFETTPKQLDLPKISQYYPILSTARSNERMLMRMQNGASVLSKFYTKGGITYLSALPLQASFSDIAQKAVFPAIVYNFAVFHQGMDKLYRTIGDETPIFIDGIFSRSEEQIKVRSKSTEFVPYLRPQGQQSLLFVSEGIQTAGNYDIVQENKSLKKISFDFDASESDMQFLSRSEIQDKATAGHANIIKNGGLAMSVHSAGKALNLWKMMLLLALLCVIAEMAVHKWMR